MMEKPPYINWEQFFTWLWVIGLSFMGGFVSFSRKVKSGHARAWNFMELIGELFTSAFVGIVTYNICQWQQFPVPLTGALVGIASHMGSRALFRMEHILNSKFPVMDPSAPKDKIDENV